MELDSPITREVWLSFICSIKHVSTRSNIGLKQYCHNPTFGKSVRMTLTLPIWGLGSPPGLPKLQNSIAGVKTPRIEVFPISLENYRSAGVENGLA